MIERPIPNLSDDYASAYLTEPSNGQKDPAASVDQRAVAVAIRNFVQGTGLHCCCIDRASSAVVSLSHPDLIPLIPTELQSRLDRINSIELYSVGEQVTCFAMPMPSDPQFVLTGYVFASKGHRPAELLFIGMELDRAECLVESWIAEVPVCDEKLLVKLLDTARREFAYQKHDAEVQVELSNLSEQIDYCYEEISLLHRLTHHLQLSRPKEELADMCVKGIYTLIESGGAAICLDDDVNGMYFLTQGRLPFDSSGLARLLARFETHDWAKPLVKNKLQHTLVGADFPGLKNLIIVPIGDPQHRRGWILATNLRGNRDFGTVESNLLLSLATILGTHVRNAELYDEHEDLLIGFVRSMVSALDAKDPYTRGHSERVALISKRIGQQMSLPPQDLEDIYLSGLLHDIGKVGVDDRILAKPGQLTEEEFRLIQKHPIIGYQILQQLKHLKPILPGVRNHHEAFNGRGYPDKLKGDDIPLIARIIAVADSFDAMVSDRPYRKGMPLERLDDIFRRGAGEQWDPRVVEAFFQARDEIVRLCESYSPEKGNLLNDRVSNRSGILVSGRQKMQR